MGRFERWARQSGSLRPVPVVWLAGICLLLIGCGGGAQANIQPPPPVADFSISISPPAISVSQGATSGAVTVSITPQNGFSGTVQVSLAGLPAGVTVNPSSPFLVNSGANTSLVFSADNSAVTGTASLTATGTSGTLTHNSPLGLTVQKGTTSSLPRANYVRTDSLANMDFPPGEPHRRHIALDPASGHLFIANRARNSVVVLSTRDASSTIEINAPGASSADISADGKTVWIGSLTQAVYEIDVASLQIRATHVVDGLTPLPGTVFDRPEEVLSLSSGKVVIRMREPASPESLLALWDPIANSLTNLTSVAPQVFQSGLGVMAKSADGSRVLVAAADSSGELAVFDGNGSLVTGPITVGGGSTSYAAANGVGTRFALLFSGSSGPEVLLLDGSLNVMGTYSATNPSSVLFLQDGSALAVTEQFGTGRVVSLLGANDLHPIGKVADAAIAGLSSQLEAADSSKLLFGTANRGVSFVDAAAMASLGQIAPAFSSVPIVQPATGANTGGTSTVVTGASFGANPVVEFGSQVANVQSAAPAQIQVSSPANAANGAVNVTASFSDGWSAIAPDAFSYGPQILKVLPNAGNKSGNEIISIYGYGFGSDVGKLTVKIGGTTAAVQKIDQVPGVSSSLGLDATYPFPLQRATLVTPAGASGNVDVVVTSSSGTTTLARGFAFLQSEQVTKLTGFYKFLLYDRKRNRLYLSNIDHVDIFDLGLNAFVGTIQPAGGPPPNSGLRGLALTPDDSQLVIADFGAQSIYLMNPDTATGSASFVGGIPGYANSGPSLVAPTSAKTVFVGMSAEGGTQAGCSSCIAQMDVSTFPPTVAPATQPEISFLTGSPLLRSNAAGDQVFFAFSAAPGGPIASWSASNPGQFQTFSANASTMDVAVAQDGNAVAIRENSQLSIRSAGLALLAANSASELEKIPGRTEVPGAALHPTGALLYVPFLTGPAPAFPPATNVLGGIDIRDARTGSLRLRIFLPEPLSMLSADVDGQHGSFLAIDENGQRLFALTSSGVTVIQLANVPLGIGSLNPASGSTAGGTAVTLRGSGFQPGTKLTIGGKSVSVSVKDMNTLSFVTPVLSVGAQQIVLTNANGETTSLDAAFTAN